MNNLQEIVDELSIGQLTNTDENTFWYSGKGFTKRYKHEEGKKGDTFYDGNNGDRWQVLAVNTEYNRMIVENKTQDGMKLVFWD